MDGFSSLQTNKDPQIVRTGIEGSILTLRGPGQGQILEILLSTGFCQTLPKPYGFRFMV